jgi:rhamnulokinase
VTARVLVVDLGATSIRVAAVELDADRVSVDVLHRWRHAPVADSQGALRWDWTGVAGWGVDYAFVDESGDLVDLPFAYRDDRTAGWESVARRIGRDRLYETTGVQLMGINTIFQLAADRRERSTGPQRCCCCPISW